MGVNKAAMNLVSYNARKFGIYYGLVIMSSRSKKTEARNGSFCENHCLRLKGIHSVKSTDFTVSTYLARIKSLITCICCDIKIIVCGTMIKHGNLLLAPLIYDPK